MGGLEVGLIRDLATPTTLCRVRALARYHGRLSQTYVLVQQKLPSAWSFEHRQIQGRGDEGTQAGTAMEVSYGVPLAAAIDLK